MNLMLAPPYRMRTRQPRLAFSHSYRTPQNPGHGGGDVVAIAEHDDGTTALLVADISAKGVEGIALASWLATLFAVFAAIITRPAEILEELNGSFCAAVGANRGIFAGAFIGRFSSADRRLIYTCAGIERPLLFNKMRTPRYLRYGGIVLGVDERASYRDEELAIDLDETLIAYTDGVTESLGSSRFEPLGENGVLEAIQESTGKLDHPQSDRILAEVDRLNGGIYHDDATLAVVSYRDDHSTVERTVR